MYDYTNTTTDLANPALDTAIISVGATEQCGPCLSLQIDTLVAQYFARHWGQVLDAYVLPTLPFNTSEEHTDFRGTVSVTPTVLMEMLEEIAAGLRNQGFRKQVLTCGHVGSYWASAFINHINHRFDDIILVNAHVDAAKTWKAALEKAGLAGRNEIHGGLTSKCIALYLYPETVREGGFGSKIEPSLTAYIDYGVWHRVAQDGCWGQVEGDENPEDLNQQDKTLLETFVNVQGQYLKGHLNEACRLKGIGEANRVPGPDP